MKCPNCGKEIANDSVFCEYCGAKLVTPQKSHKGIWVFIIIIVLTTIAGGTLYYFYEETQTALAQAKRDVEDARIAQENEMIRREAAEDKVQKAEKACKEAEKKERATQNAEKDRKVNKNEIRKELLKQGYVDLGLPSGTLWKNENEEGEFYADEATKLWGKNIPTDAQWKELQECCEWKWNNDYVITGKNGASILLSTRMLSSTVYSGKTAKGTEITVRETTLSGCYWSSTVTQSGMPHYLYACGYVETKDDVKILETAYAELIESDKDKKCSVRLIY